MDKKCMKELLDLLEAEGLLKTCKGEPDLICPERFVTNSKEVTPGSLFICKGFTFKPEYLQMAIEKGAVCYLADTVFSEEIPAVIVRDLRKAVSVAARWFYNNPGREMYLTGITGTKGKTTTAYILKSILDTRSPHRCALFSTMEINTGTESRVSHLTTPEPAELQSYFREAADHGCTNVVMEVSSQAMKLDRVYGEHFPIGIFLNVDEDHIGGKEHASLEEYVACKVAFLAQCDTVIVNRHTRFFDQVMEGCRGKHVILYGHDETCDGRITGLCCNENGSSFEVNYQGKAYAFTSGLVGRFNVENLTAAILAALEMGIDPETIQEGIRSVLVPGRMMLMEYNGIHIVVDYAHNYLSFLNVYRAVQETFSPKAIRSVFGSAGERSEVRRHDMGKLAQEYADYVYLTADDPGFESVEEICAQIAAHIQKPCRIIPDRLTAIRTALSEAEPGDVVILAGKGMDASQRVKGVYEPYITDGRAAKLWIEEQKQQ